MDERVIAGKYRLVRQLGVGGMGSVWLAEHTSLQTPVAIKLIHPDLVGVPAARGRFDREARAVAKLRSAHVVQVLDHGVTDAGEPYLVMECLTGQDLRARIDERGRLTPAETARVVLHVARALTRAHEAGVVHRDLKPENLFACPGEDGEIIKVLDFGVAKATDLLASGGLDPTRTGELIGTPCYMSPEQAQGLKGLDFRSDLWALGVVVFECLTGERPFDAKALGPLIAQIAAGPIVEPSSFIHDLSPEIDAWMARALTRDPEGRFASARAMSDAFAQAVGASAIPWGSPSIAPAPASAPARPVVEDELSTLPRPPAPRVGTVFQVADGGPASTGASSSLRQARVLVVLAVLVMLASAGIALALR